MAIEMKKPGRGTRGGKTTDRQGPPIDDIYAVQDSNWDLLEIPFDQIDPNPFNDRAMGDLDELASDIKTFGLLQPISVMHCEVFVKEHGERFPDKCAGLTRKYILGWGERRWRAATMASEGTSTRTIKAHLRNDLAPVIRFALIKENYHRLDPSPIERARHIQSLHDGEGMGYTEICEALSIKSRGTITKLLDLLKLPDAIQDALNRREISQKAALALGELDEQESVVALRMVLDDEMKPLDAVHHVRVSPHTVSLGNTTQHDGEHDTPPEPSVDEYSRPEPTPDPLARAELIEPGHDDVREQDSAPTPPSAPSAARPPSRAPSDNAAADRAAAGRARELVCIQWLSGDGLPAHEQLDDLVRRALLAGGKTDARTRAHSWLVRTGKAHFDIRDPEGYFGAVLSSGDEQLIVRATWATALSSNELRASDRRRPAWDRHDAAYVRLLMEAAGYEPSTQWERGEVERLAVSLGNSSGTEHPDQETA